MLLVDDHPQNLVALEAILEPLPVRLVRAGSAEEALREVAANDFAVIVLDVQMPGIDGPTFARELRTRLRHVPLVILTAAPDPKHEADRCNAEAYLAKPFHAEDLLRLVRRFST